MDKKITERMPDMLEAIKKIRADCFALKRQGNLTEYAKGQLDLIRIILNELESD